MKQIPGIDLLCLILANYRLSMILSKDKITDDLRARIGQKASGSRAWQFIADLIGCPYCLGVWFGFILFIVARSRAGRFLVGGLAIAGGQDVLQTFIDCQREGDSYVRASE